MDGAGNLTDYKMQGYHFDTIDSTNEAAKGLILDGTIRQCDFIVAREQSAGKGQRGSRWISPKDAGIILSVVDIPSAKENPPVTMFTLAAGVACVEVLRELTGIEVQLKPVNDLYVGDCKLGGILTESVMKQQSIEALITGIGINLKKADREISDAKTKPICIEEFIPQEQFSSLDENELVAMLVHRVLKWNQAVWTNQHDLVRESWERYKIPGTTNPIQS